MFKSEVQKFRLSVDDYQKELENKDKLRTRIHNSLISKLGVFNRYLFNTYGFNKIPVGGIFSLNPRLIERRDKVGDWAGYLREYVKLSVGK